MTVPTLATARLTLRDFRAGDLDYVTRHCSDFQVSRWLVQVPYPYSRQDAADFLEVVRAGDAGLMWVIIRDSGLIGAISVGKELGYWMAPQAWGQGFMTEAAQAVVDHTFGSTDIDVMHSNHFAENRASQRILQKLGFIDVGPNLHFSKARQKNVPGRRLELTRDDWHRLRTAAQ